MQQKLKLFLIPLLLFALLAGSAGSVQAQSFELRADHSVAGVAAPNLIQDPSLEAAIASTAIWKQASTNSDSPLCNLSIPECNFGAGTAAARTGSVWALFGGIDWTDPESISPEVSDLYQMVTFPVCGASLQFYFWIGAAPAGSDASDLFQAKIDGTTVFSANATQRPSYSSYTLVTVDVSSYANGASHKVEFYSVTTGQQVIFNLDDVSLTRTCVTISGNAGVAGATLSYTGGPATADGSGNYSFTVPYSWSGTVTPSKTGYVFSPANRPYSNLTTDQTGQNYTAAAVHTISGNTGVGGVTLSYDDGGPKTVISEANGNYSFTILDGWNGTVTPSHPCYTFNPANRPYSNVTADQTAQNYTPVPISGSGCTDVDVLVANANQGTFTLDTPASLTQTPLNGISNGPVKIMSTVPLVAGQRTIYKINRINTSFSEMMALPNGQLNTVYWLPYYNNVDLDSQVRIGNVNNTDVTVHVYVAGTELPSPYSPFTVPANSSVRKFFPGVSNGPMKIEGTLPIVVAERVIYKVNGVNTSYSETMALPAGQVDTSYWLPYYNNVDLDSQVRIGNVNNTDVTVHVYVGGAELIDSPFTVPANSSVRKSFPGVSSGPMKIEGTLPIVVAERVIYKVNGVNTSYSEMMALPNTQVDTEYWLTRYNNVDLDSQLRIGNPSSVTDANVQVFVNGALVPNGSFTVTHNQSARKSFPGVNGGLVRVVSDIPIVVAERIIYKVNGINTSFSEMMALPLSQLDSVYWLPWYNNVDLDSVLRFGYISP